MTLAGPDPSEWSLGAGLKGQGVVVTGARRHRQSGGLRVRRHEEQLRRLDQARYPTRKAN